MKLERKMREEKNKRFKKTKFSGCVNDTEKGIGNTEKEFEKEKMREEDEKRTTVNMNILLAKKKNIHQHQRTSIILQLQ